MSGGGVGWCARGRGGGAEHPCFISCCEVVARRLSKGLRPNPKPEPKPQQAQMLKKHRADTAKLSLFWVRTCIAESFVDA